jgi:hypothetical protein
VIALVPVRAGQLPLGGDEAVAEAGGHALLVGDGTASAAEPFNFATTDPIAGRPPTGCMSFAGNPDWH